MELEETILSEVTQLQQDKHISFLIFRHRTKDCQFTTPTVRGARKQGVPQEKIA